MSRRTQSILLALALSTAGGIAYAARTVENDAQSIASAKISLVQAVTIAEQHVKGKAARAEYEHSRQGWVYDVEVVSGAKVFDVRIDAAKGVVISSAEDKADRDDAHDKQD